MTDPLHVLWTPSWYPDTQYPLNGSFFLEQINMLRSGHTDVGVINLTGKTLWHWRPQAAAFDIGERTIRQQVPTIPLGIGPGDRQLFAAVARRTAKLYADQFGVPEVIHAHSTFPGAVVAHSLAKYWNIPYGITEHRPSAVSLPKRRWRNRLRRHVIQAADFRLAVSTVFARQLSETYGCDFATVTNPVPAHFFARERQPHDHYTFIHISNLERRKRVEEVIDAFALVQTNYPDIRLKIVGGQPDTLPGVQAHAQRRGISDFVIFTGPVSRSEIVNVLADTDCLVLVSATESAGVVFAEAQSLGIPCIASDTPGGAYMVTQESGIVVPIDNPTALTNAMRHMVERGHAEYCPQKVRQQAWERFGPDEFVRHHRQIYEYAIATHVS